MTLLFVLSIPSLIAVCFIASVITVQTIYPRLKVQRDDD